MKLTKPHLKLIAALGVIFLFFPLAISLAHNEGEGITNFDSKITVNADGSMNVSENIEVISQGQQIIHGIYRDFPTTYLNNFITHKVGFKILSITRDGKLEPYHTESLSNGVRIYLGDAKVVLEPGYYSYQITYWTNRQLGFFEDHDELYWNVTGQDWAFPIEEASAEISLPSGVDLSNVKTDGFTGYTGATEKNFSVITKNNKLFFQTTKPLDEHQGLTIVAAWPKNFVSYPTQLKIIGYWLMDNAVMLWAILGVLIIFIFYLTTWLRFGVDPKKGTIIPEYDPPTGFSPAEIRYLKKMGFDNKAFVSQLIDLAVSGFIKINKTKNKYTIETTTSEPAAGLNREFINSLISDSHNSLELSNTNYQKIQAAKKALLTSLTAKIKNKYFTTSGRYLAEGLMISLGLLIIMFVNSSPAGFLAYLLNNIIFLGLIILIFSLKFKNIQNQFNLYSAGSLIAVGLGAVIIIFSSLGNISLAGVSSLYIFIAFVLIGLINTIFAFLLKAPTAAGRKILDHIEGFKWFLSVTEKDRMNFHNPPEKTPELFEKYLAYALALGVENKWAEQFSAVFAKLSEQGTPYAPVWFVGTNFNPANVGDFTHNLSSSFSHAVSSSSTPPGSSSGFGGGAGGGGGGGGGGGW